MRSSKSPALSNALAATVVVAGVFLLYVLTLAPTILWGDDAELQRLAVLGGTPDGPRSYPLWQAAATFAARLPFGEAAWRVNLVSAIFAAGAVGCVWGAVLVLTGSPAAATTSALALGLAHTFWLHAVRTEVYSLFLALLAASILLLLLWQRSPTRWWALVLGLLLAGLARAAHPLIMPALPALAVLVLLTPGRRLVACGLGLVAFVLGAGLAGLLLTVDATSGALSGFFAGLLALRPRDLLLWLGLLGYQFLALTPLGLLGLLRLQRDDWPIALFLLLLYAGNLVFVLVFRVPDQYVFFLPSYLAFALAIGAGMLELRAWLGRLRLPVVGIVLLLGLLLPPLVYRLTPWALNQAGVNLLGARELPYRDANTFFLDPSKRGYDGARRYASQVLGSLPANAALLVDWTPHMALRYLQEVEGLRPDIELHEIYAGTGQQLPWLVAQSASRPVFIADTQRYYDLEAIEEVFAVEPFGLVYRLTPRHK